MRYLVLATAMVVSLVAWGALVFAALDEGWGHSPIAAPSDVDGFLKAGLAERETGGNLGIILIEKGEPAGSLYRSSGDPVDENAVFQVASLGKWLTAWGVMALVEDGRIDLDAPADTYLTRWHLPPSEFDPSGVTVRRLLSHTAGLDDGLGYDGFDKPEQRQTLEASLTQAKDASPGKNGIVRLGSEPGSGWAYSGGGYTLLQLIVEEVSGQPFAEFMDERVFTPLGMTRTTFDHRKAIELGRAQNFRNDGTTEPFRWYTALAPTALFTTPADLATFIAAQAPGHSQPVLTQASTTLMRKPHASSMGADVWGLGVMLYAPNNRGSFIIGHDGNNGPAINTAARLDPETGDGIVVLETGNRMLATELGGEWVFWKTGNVDSLTFVTRLPNALLVFAIGALVIVIATLLVGWRMRRKAKPSA